MSGTPPLSRTEIQRKEREERRRRRQEHRTSQHQCALPALAEQDESTELRDLREAAHSSDSRRSTLTGSTQENDRILDPTKTPEVTDDESDSSGVLEQSLADDADLTLQSPEQHSGELDHTAPAATDPPAQDDMTTKRIEYPDFWPEMPEQWINVVESIFAEHKIEEDAAKYNAMLCRIKPEYLKELADVLKNPPAEDKYKDLKEKLVSRYTDSADKQLHNLFNKMTLGDQKPSQLLRQMRSQAGTSVAEDALIVKWLSLLPREMHTTLTVFKKKYTAAEMEEAADKLHDLSGGCSTSISSISNTSINQQLPTSADVAATSRRPAMDGLPSGTNDIATLLRQVLATNQQLLAQSRGRSSGHHPGEANGNFGGGSGQRSRSRSPGRYGNLCYYHFKFGAAANRCKEPCQFSQAPQFLPQQPHQQFPHRMHAPQYVQQQPAFGLPPATGAPQLQGQNQTKNG